MFRATHPSLSSAIPHSLLGACLVGTTALSAWGAATSAEPLDTLKITEVVQSVQIINASTRKSKQAKANELLKAPDALSTGAASRVEMLAVDGTLTRVGANSLFRFVPGKREVDLEKGSVLFHSPSGKGGGVIRTPSASASVLGTSIIVTATRNGGFKLLVLEGKAKAALPNGTSSTISAGQMTFVLPGSRQFGPVFNFRLKDQVSGSGLVKGFKAQVPSMEKIISAVALQETAIATGKAQATNLLVADTQVYETRVVDSSLSQTRMVVKENATPYVTSSRGQSSLTPMSLALGTPVSLSSSTTTPPASHLFSFLGADLPQELATSMGDTLADVFRKWDSGTLFGALIGSEISISDNGAQLDLQNEVQTALGKQIGELVVYAPGKFSVQGRAMDVDLSDSGVASAMANLSQQGTQPNSNGVSKEIPFWLISQTELSLSKVVVDSNTPFSIFGRSHNPNAKLIIQDSALMNAGGGLNLYGGQIQITNSPIVASSAIDVWSLGDITISNPDGKVRQITSGYSVPGASSGAQSAADLGYSKTTSFDALGDISVTNAAMNSAFVNMSARTVILKNVNFVDGSKVELTSRDGLLAELPNQNQKAVEGKVNYISGVMYGESPAQTKTNGYQPSGQSPLTGQPITILKLK